MKNVQTLYPFVYWAQNKENIYLKVDLINILKDPDVIIESTFLDFSCQGTGAQGNNNYRFDLNFYSEIKNKDCTYNISDKNVTFILVKAESIWWPRLISKPVKPHWLRIDFDRWQSPEDMDDNEKVGDILKDHPDIFEQLQKEEIGYRREDSRKVYLTFYNFGMYLGYLYICIVLLMKYLKQGTRFFPKAFETVGTPMYILQSIQMFEVIHALIGIMESNVLMILLRTVFRIFILCAMVGQEPRVQSEPVIFFLFLVWSIMEIIRYPYYISVIYRKENLLLSWLKNNAWMIFFPIGCICEMIICYKNLVFIDQSRKWSIEMPNSVNFIFNFPFCLRISILFLFIPSFSVMMAHLYNIRRQKLKGGKLKRR